jgi:hypothetical protein
MAFLFFAPSVAALLAPWTNKLEAISLPPARRSLNCLKVIGFPARLEIASADR